jgi:hypothetical protein
MYTAVADQRVFKMTNTGIYLNEEECIPYEKTNLPFSYFKFTNEKDIYWLVKPSVKSLNIDKVLSVEVIDYRSTNVKTFAHQQLKHPIVRIEFKNLNWKKLQVQLASYFPNKFNSELFDSEGMPHSQLSHTRSGNEKGVFKEVILERQFRVDFSQVQIKEGYIEFLQILPETGIPIIVKIFNSFLTSKYELIKDYLANRMGKKTFKADVKITLQGNRIVSVEAKSKDIDTIDQSFIDIIKIKQIKSLKKVLRLSNDKALHTIDELVKNSKGLVEGLFEYHIDEIIKILTDNYEHRNSKHIVYLSKKHHFGNDIVHLTLKPLFGFVFYIEDSEKLHYIWELLDSHATYIWSFPRDKYSREQCYGIIESSINSIHTIGRNSYKEGYQKNKQNFDYLFCLVEHELATVSAELSFEKWKATIRGKISL